MKTRYFQITIEKPVPVDLTLDEQRSAPHHSMGLKEYETKMIKVDYHLAKNTPTLDFLLILEKALKRQYKIVDLKMMDENYLIDGIA